MHIVNLNNITVNYAGREIFSNLNWSIDHRTRTGLIGPNGAGKSTLLRLISRELSPDAGVVSFVNPDKDKPLRVGYLHQTVSLPHDRTVYEVAMALPPELHQLEKRLAEVESQLATPAVYSDMDRLQRALARQEILLKEYDELGGSRYETKIKETLSFLGIMPEHFDLPVKVLSGGQKKLLALARLAARLPEVLLLDEPDNHLDLASKRKLERFIHAYEGAVIIVSHDRYLLDEIASEIVELDAGQLTVYPGNYTAYVTERELRRLRQQQLYVAQQKEIARIEAAIKRFEHWASIVVDERHIRQARHRRKMLERMEANGEIIQAVRERKNIGLEINGWRGSNKVLDIIDLAMGFDDDLLFLDLNLLLMHGERMGVIGANGSGKSVLMKVILGEIEPVDGIVKIGPSVKVGYYAQEHQTLDAWLDRTPLDLIRDAWPHSEGDAVAFLLKLLFTYEQVRQPIRTLSGGERSRLQLALLMLSRPNLLLLDEPTNNLDIPSAEVLETVLDEFEGTILVISHDRYFLDRVVDRVAVLEDGSLHGYDGGYTDYLTSVDL